MIKVIAMNVCMSSYSINPYFSIIRDGTDAQSGCEAGNKTLQVELDRVYDCFMSEMQAQVKDRTTPLTHDEKENLKMMFGLLLDLQGAAHE